MRLEWFPSANARHLFSFIIQEFCQYQRDHYYHNQTSLTQFPFFIFLQSAMDVFDFLILRCFHYTLLRGEKEENEGVSVAVSLSLSLF